AGMAGTLSASVALNVPGVTFSGAFGLAINNTSSAIQDEITVGGQTVTIDVPAGPYVRVEGRGVTLRIGGAGGLALGGDFAFEKTAAEIAIVARNVSLGLGDGTTNFISVTSGQGAFLVTTGAAGGLAGVLSAAVAVNIPGIQVSGTFSVEINNTTAAVAKTFDVGGSTVSLNLPAGKFVRVVVTGASLAIAGQVLTASRFEFQQSRKPGLDAVLNTADDERVVSVIASGVGLRIGSSTHDFVTVTGGAAALEITGAGLAGFVTAGFDLNIPTAPPITAHADSVTVLINRRTVPAQLDEALLTQVFGAGHTVPSTLPAGPFLQVQVLNLALDVMGQQLSGNFLFEQAINGRGEQVIRVAVTGVSLNIADIVHFSAGQGALVISNQGLSAQISGAIAIDNVGIPLSFQGAFKVSINNSAEAVYQKFVVGSDIIELDLPAGPYIRVEGTGVRVQIAGQVLSGDFAFERITSKDALGASRTIVKVVASNIGLRLGNGTTDFVVVSGGSGMLLISPQGMAGQVQAPVQLNIPGVVFVGTFGIKINNTSAPVNETFTLGGTETSLVIPEAGPFLRVEGTGIKLQVLGQSLSGDFSFEKVASGGADHNLATTADNGTVIRIAASNVRLGLGSGTTDYVVVEDGGGSLLITSAGVAGRLQATVRVQNIDGVSFAGTFRVSVNNMTTRDAATGNMVGVAVSEQFEVGGETQTLNLPAGPFVRVEGGRMPDGSGTPITLTVLGQTLTGNFSFEQTTTAAGTKVIRVAVGDVGLRLTAGDKVLFDLQGISGALLIMPQGLAGQLTLAPEGGFHLNIPTTDPLFSLGVDKLTISINRMSAPVKDSFSVGGETLTLDLPAGPYVRVEAVGASLTIDTVTLSGNFVFEQATSGGPDHNVATVADNFTVTRIGAADVCVTVEGKSLISVQGALVVLPTGVAGVISGTVSVSSDSNF
ncbi:MAG: hypothetical protein NTU94_00015, partial [Planctomycetota bacterium]|nr:hypothetical protein [Planctomycetota bacterium]